MAGVDRIRASLRVFSDQLDPDDVPQMLGAQPTKIERKGENRRRVSEGAPILAKTNAWRLQSDNRRPGDLENQLDEILGQLTDDLRVWDDLASRARMDMFCGLFMRESNEGLSLSPELMKALADRHIALERVVFLRNRDSQTGADLIQGQGWEEAGPDDSSVFDGHS